MANDVVDASGNVQKVEILRGTLDTQATLDEVRDAYLSRALWVEQVHQPKETALVDIQIQRLQEGQSLWAVQDRHKLGSGSLPLRVSEVLLKERLDVVRQLELVMDLVLDELLAVTCGDLQGLVDKHTSDNPAVVISLVQN